MYSVNKLTRITIDTETINSAIYRIFGIEYTKKMYKVQKSFDYHRIEFDFDDVDKARLLADELQKYDSSYLSIADIYDALIKVHGLNKASTFMAIMEDELETLKDIRRVLKADNKFDDTLIVVQFHTYHDDDIERGRVTILAKCDELELF